MMTKMTFRTWTAVAALGLTLGLSGIGVAPALAEVPSADDSNANTIVRVLNNHRAAVRVYAESEAGRRVWLGYVDREGLRDLTIPADLLEDGNLRLAVYPVAALPGSGLEARPQDGIRTGSISLSGGETVDVWLEPELLRSAITIEGD